MHLEDPEPRVPAGQSGCLLRRSVPVLVVLFLASCSRASTSDAQAETHPAARSSRPAQIQHAAKFTGAAIAGLHFAVGDAYAGTTDASGRFGFLPGRPVQFFLGRQPHRLIIGTILIREPSDVGRLTLHDLEDAHDDGDGYLGNLLRLLSAFDDNGNIGDGIVLSDLAHSAFAQAVSAHGNAVDFTAPAKAFASNEVIRAALVAGGRSLREAGVLLAEHRSLFPQSRSSTIAVTRDGMRTVVVNRHSNSISVLRVRDHDGDETSRWLGEVPVGRGPRFVALSPDDRYAYVTNSVDGTISVIDVAASKPHTVGAPLAVGPEPRGIALTPSGRVAFVANHMAGTVTVVDLTRNQVVRTFSSGGRPYAVYVTNDGDRNDHDEHVIVTELFAPMIDPAERNWSDDAARSGLRSFPLAGLGL
jgi:YVTN family beta-propeller protein